MLEGIGQNWEKRFVEKGMAAGMAQGMNIGREEGLTLGRQEGMTLGRQEGLALGEARGERSAFRNVILEILASRFGGLPAQISTALDGIEDAAVLKDLALAATRADSPAAFLREVEGKA